MGSLFEDVSVGDWAGVQSVYLTRFAGDQPGSRHAGKRWLFRGDRDPDNVFKTSFDKAVEASHCAAWPTARLGEERRQLELALIREFRRRYHHYDARRPKQSDLLQWLSIMQHYEAPTRLLDMTYSFYVAVYFALNRSIPGSGSKKAPQVIALEANAIRDASNEILHVRTEPDFTDEQPDVFGQHQRSREYVWFKKYFLGQNALSFVYPLSPYVLNERLTIQQGSFLCPGNIRQSFSLNLETTLQSVHAAGPVCLRLALDMRDEERREALFQLNRMQISQATLFPGLQGFAGSLRNAWFMLRGRGDTDFGRELDGEDWPASRASRPNALAWRSRPVADPAYITVARRPWREGRLR